MGIRSVFKKRKIPQGLAFGEFIHTEKIKNRSRGYYRGDASYIRLFILPVVLVVVIVVLFFRLVSLQIVQGSYYRFLSDSNRTRTYIIHAPRGIIFDRNGVPLVFNTPGFREEVKGKTKLISREKANILIAKGAQSLEVDSLREYPFKDITSHVLGYIGQISEDELQSTFYKEYNSGDLMGKMGIEKQYESKLKGFDGKELVEVDANGKIIRTIGKTDPFSGENITLTLDIGLQKKAYSAFPPNKKGAVIVSKPNGEVLSLVSFPSFNSNLFTLPDMEEKDSTATPKEIQLTRLLSDSTTQPLLNRAISGVYPPGSTFKLVTAVSGLQNKIVDKDFEIIDNGIIQLGSFSFANWYFLEYGGTEGAVNIVKAISRSNDIYFYKLAELVGVEKLAQTARKMGAGSKSGIDLGGEVGGLIPDSAWKKKVIEDNWYLGDTYHYGIGQGYLLTTPLQVNLWTQAIVNSGAVYKPFLLSANTPHLIREKFIDDTNISLIKEGMVQSCSPGGVAWPLFDYKVKNPKLKIDGRNILEVPLATQSAGFSDYRKITIACKTGTAQHGGEEALPHAWITAFAPAYNPEIIVTVLVESAGQGSNVAAPVAKAILDEWFSR